MPAEQIGKGNPSWGHPSLWYVLVTTPWFLMAVFCLYESAVDSVIAKREKTVLGTIVAHEVANHNQYRYTFMVNGGSYAGFGHPPNGPSEIGDQLRVYYDPSNPAKNALVDFAVSEVEVLGPVPLCLLGAGAFGFYVWRRRKRLKDA